MNKPFCESGTKAATRWAHRLTAADRPMNWLLTRGWHVTGLSQRWSLCETGLFFVIDSINLDTLGCTRRRFSLFRRVQRVFFSPIFAPSLPLSLPPQINLRGNVSFSYRGERQSPDRKHIIVYFQLYKRRLLRGDNRFEFCFRRWLKMMFGLVLRGCYPHWTNFCAVKLHATSRTSAPCTSNPWCPTVSHPCIIKRFVAETSVAQVICHPNARTPQIRPQWLTVRAL